MGKNWTYSEGTMTRTYADDTPDLVVKLTNLFPDFHDYDDAQKGCIVNGTKQKLDDSIARKKDEKLTEPEKRQVQADLWERNSVDRIWNAESRTRTPSVSYTKLIPSIAPLREVGFSDDKIAATLQLPLDVVEAN